MRLRVTIADADYQRLREAADRRGLTVSECVRRALRVAAIEQSDATTERKLAAIRRAAEYSFPIPNLD